MYKNINYSGSSSGSGFSGIELTQAEYDALVAAGTVKPDVMYFITDAEELDLCQRYHYDYDIIDGYIPFRVGEKSAYFSIFLPCVLRTTPTVTLKNNQVRWESSTVKTSSVTNIEVKSMSNNHITFKLEGDFGLTSWQNCLLYDISFVLDSEIY